MAAALGTGPGSSIQMNYYQRLGPVPGLLSTSEVHFVTGSKAPRQLPHPVGVQFDQEHIVAAVRDTFVDLVARFEIDSVLEPARGIRIT